MHATTLLSRSHRIECGAVTQSRPEPTVPAGYIFLKDNQKPQFRW